MALNGDYARQRRQKTWPRDVQTDGACLDRKRRELALLNSCLSTPLLLLRPVTCAAAVELKFYLAARLKADQLLGHWPVTETARPPRKWEYAGPFAFSFGYQRADLEVNGPPIYTSLQRLISGGHESTIYTSSGMSAIAALLAASLQCKETIDVVAPADCYGETRELLQTFSSCTRLTSATNLGATALDNSAARILWLDSSVRSCHDRLIGTAASDIDLVVLDTTCFWRGSRKIERIVLRALRAGVPVALVRSHAKLDNLGIEYGRLGSIVLILPQPGLTSRAKWTGALPSKMHDAVRLLGVAPVLAHFPPFEHGSDYQACSALRTAGIVRSTRRIARGLISRWPAVKLKTFQHGLYLTLSVDATLDEVRTTADEIATTLAARALPIRHAGSFGFDFAAIEAYSDPVDARSALRVCGGDIPLDLSEEIGYGIPDLLRSNLHLADLA